MTELIYCPGALNSGCADNALVRRGAICLACESKTAELRHQRRREGDRLRASGFSLLREINGLAYWEYPNQPGRTFKHGEALAFIGGDPQ
jgi:hypothetical protein